MRQVWLRREGLFRAAWELADWDAPLWPLEPLKWMLTPFLAWACRPSRELGQTSAASDRASSPQTSASTGVCRPQDGTDRGRGGRTRLHLTCRTPTPNPGPCAGRRAQVPACPVPHAPCLHGLLSGGRSSWPSSAPTTFPGPPAPGARSGSWALLPEPRGPLQAPPRLSRFSTRPLCSMATLDIPCPPHGGACRSPLRTQDPVLSPVACGLPRGVGRHRQLSTLRSIFSQAQKRAAEV